MGRSVMIEREEWTFRSSTLGNELCSLRPGTVEQVYYKDEPSCRLSFSIYTAVITPRLAPFPRTGDAAIGHKKL